MSLLGKVLIILNGIVAALFFFLFALDWGRRETWADNYLQHQLVIEGLPLDEKEPDAQNDARIDHIRESLLKQVFQKSGGNPVPTQVKEVQRVQGLLQSEIDGKPTPREKGLRQIEVLGALAETQSDRDILAAARADILKGIDPQTDHLQQKIEAAFARALVPPSQNPAGSQKQAIADLLCRLTDVLRASEAAEGKAAPALLDSKAYERFLVVVGVSRAASALDHYAQAKKQFVADLKESIDRDRLRFAADHRLRLDQIAVQAAQLRDLEDFLNRQKTLQADKETQVANREKLRDDLKKDLQAKREANEQLLATQKAFEETLLKSRQELRDAFAENQKLEQTLKALEKSR